MSKSLKDSQLDRQNILNNPYATDQIFKQLDFKGIIFDDQVWFTTEQVAIYFEVTTRTIRNYLENYSQELNNYLRDFLDMGNTKYPYFNHKLNKIEVENIFEKLILKRIKIFIKA